MTKRLASIIFETVGMQLVAWLSRPMQNASAALKKNVSFI